MKGHRIQPAIAITVEIMLNIASLDIFGLSALVLRSAHDDVVLGWIGFCISELVRRLTIAVGDNFGLVSFFFPVK